MGEVQLENGLFMEHSKVQPLWLHSKVIVATFSDVKISGADLIVTLGAIGVDVVS